MSLTWLEIEGLASLVAGSDLELDLVAVTQILEIDLGREPRAMEEDFLAAVVGKNETEALVLHDFFDGAVHWYARGRTRAPLLLSLGRAHFM